MIFDGCFPWDTGEGGDRRCRQQNRASESGGKKTGSPSWTQIEFLQPKPKERLRSNHRKSSPSPAECRETAAGWRDAPGRRFPMSVLPAGQRIFAGPAFSHPPKQQAPGSRHCQCSRLCSGRLEDRRSARSGMATLVLAGREKFLFDRGHGLTEAMVLAIKPADVRKVFLTHSIQITSSSTLSSAFPWASAGHKPLQVWGPGRAPDR